MRNKKYRGFTLIELLVVIAIIGLLSSVVLASLNTARMKSRDAKRMSDLKELSTAIELFYDAAGTYPREGCNPDTSATGSSGCPNPPTNNEWRMNGLAATHYSHNITEFIPVVPLDPLNNSTYYYQYEPHCGQGGGKKDGYWVRVRLEATGSWYYVKGGIQSSPVNPICSSSMW